MTERSYELPDDITTLGGMVIFVLINTDIWGARPCGFRIPKLSQVHVLSLFLRACAVVAVLKLAGKQCVRFCRSYWSVLPQLDPKTVPRCYRSRQKNLSPASISICNILDLKNLLTVTDRDKPPAPGSADKNVDVTELPLACRWRVLRGCSPHCRRAGGV